MSILVTAGPITADAATAKVVGVKKTITVSASATNKVTGLSKAEKKVVKVTKKGKKFTIKGLKAGKATFKIGKKSYTVKVGATTVKAAKTKLTLTKGKKATLKFTIKSGNGDTLTFKASNKNVTLAKTSAKIAKSAASVKATAKKVGKTTITATSKATGKKATVTVTVKNAAKPATTTPGASNTPVATATGSATNTPEATATATATASGSATNTPDVTATPTATGSATATPVATGSATNTPEATEVPTEAPTKAPEVVTGGTITVAVKAGDKVVTGASIKVLSGTSVVASTSESASTNFTTKKLENGTYTLVVERAGYETYTTTVVVNGDVAVNAELVAEATVTVKSIKAQNVNRYNDETYYDAMELSSKLPRNASITVEFSGTMDTDSVNVNTVKLYKVDGNIPVGVTKAKITNKKKTVATIETTAMEKNTEYKLILTSSISSEAGKKLQQTEYKFTTSNEGVLSKIYAFDAANSTAGEVTLNSDLDRANDYFQKNDVLYVTLDSAVDAGSITSDSVQLKNVTDGTNVNIKSELYTAELAATDVASKTYEKGDPVTVAETNKTIKITLLDDLKLKKAYKLELNGVRLANGGNLTSISQRFVVGSTAPDFTAARTLGASSDNLSTDIDNVARVNGKLSAINVPTQNIPEAGFGLVFNLTPVTDDATVTEDAFSLTDETNKKNIPFTFNYDAALKQVKITPTEDLPEDAVIKITTSIDASIKNALGDAMREKEYFIKTYDLTAPTVVSVSGSTENVKVNQQQTVTVSFSEEIGFTKIAGSTVTITPITAGADIASTYAVQTTSDKLDNAKAVAIVKAGVDPTSTLGANDFVKIDSMKVSADRKSLTIKYTPTALGTTYQLIFTGKNDDGRMFVSDVANGTAATDAANPLAANYTVAITTEAQDVTGPEVLAIGTLEFTDANADAFDTEKFKEFTNGQSNIDKSKKIVVQFDEIIDTLTAGNYNTVAGTGNANGNIVLERYNYSTSKWEKAGTPSGGGADADQLGITSVTQVDDSIAKKTALVIAPNKLVTNTKYRLTINPTVGNTSIVDIAADKNVMAKKYTVEFTTGKVEGISIAASNPSVSEGTQFLASTNKVKATAAGKSVLGTVTENDIDSFGANGHILAIELSDGTYMFTTQNGTVASHKLTLNDPLTADIKQGAKVYDLSATAYANGLYAQYDNSLSKSDSILVQVVATAGLDEDTIQDAVKLYDAKDNSVVDADITYYTYTKTAGKDAAWVCVNPKADLKSDASYYVKVDGLKDKLGNVQEDASVKTIFSFKTKTETKKASVSNFNIYDGQMDVGVKTAFTFDVKDTTVTDFSSYDGTTDSTGDKITVEDGSAKLGLSVAYDKETGKVTVTPDAPLAANRAYKLTIQPDAFGGTAMGTTPTTINFKTGTAEAAKIVSVQHTSIGNDGLDYDKLDITLDAKLNATVITDITKTTTETTSGTLDGAVELLKLVKFNDAKITAGNIASIVVSSDKKKITIVFKSGANAAGEYLIDGTSSISATTQAVAGSRTTANTLSDAYTNIFDTASVTITAK